MQLLAGCSTGRLEDIETEGQSWQEDGVTGAFLLGREAGQAGSVHLQQLAIQGHLAARDQHADKPLPLADISMRSRTLYIHN